MRRFSAKRREALTGLGYAALPLAGFTVFFSAPFSVSIVQTFYSGTGGRYFVGFSNYASIFQSETFRLALVNTFKFIGVGVPLILALSFAISLALQGQIRGKRVFRSLFIMPLVVPVSSVILVFSIVFERSGVINTALAAFGHPDADFFGSNKAFAVLIILYVWKNCGYDIVLLMVGLSRIPPEYYDAARVDGAGRWRILVSVTLPLMIPTIFFTFVISIINCFKSFREAYALGGSYPHRSIYMLQHFMNNNFYNLNYPRLSVALLLTFIIIIALVSIMYAFRRKAGDNQL